MFKWCVVDYEGVFVLFDVMVDVVFEYVEVWNQCVFIYYLKGQFDKFLEDLDKVLVFEFWYFGVLFGKGCILMEQGWV